MRVERGYLFNWIRVGGSLECSFICKRIFSDFCDFACEKPADALSLFPLLKNSMHVKQILDDIALWFAILRLTLLCLKRITVLQAGNFILLRILCDARSFSLCYVTFKKIASIFSLHSSRIYFSMRNNKIIL